VKSGEISQNMTNLGDDSLLPDGVELRESQQVIRLSMSDHRVANSWLNIAESKAVDPAHRCHDGARGYRCWLYDGCCSFAGCWLLVIF
jgi:hypothetical protein